MEEVKCKEPLKKSPYIRKNSTNRGKFIKNIMFMGSLTHAQDLGGVRVILVIKNSFLFSVVRCALCTSLTWENNYA